MKKVHVLILLLLANIGFAQLRKVGYMPSWAGDANSIQYSKLTHINYSFAIPNYDGTLKPVENPGKLNTIVSLSRSAGVKVLIAIGGWSYQGASLDPVFESLASTAQGRTNLVNACVNMVNQYGLDGVDVDWEYPDAGASANNYAALINELANAMHSRGKVVTAAIPHSSYFGGGYNSSIFTQLDWINLMAYDANDFQHATMQYAIDGLNYWCGNRGLARNRAVLGVPAYGRPSWESYATLLARGANPEADVFGSVGYNGLATIRQKSQYVKDNGYGGIMMWELSQDVNNQYSLLSAIHTVLGTSTPPPPPTQQPYAGVINLPGKVEAENYDKGGQGVSFSDASTNNEGGAFRTDAVDLEACTEGGFNVGWIAAGEWLEYTVNITAAGTYNFTARVASTSANNSFHLELDGQRVGSSFVVPNTGAWQTWTNVSFQASVGAGQKTLRIVMDQGNFNLNFLQVSTVTTNPNTPPTVSLTSPANGATYNVGTAITLSANASDANGSVTKVEFFSNGTKVGEDNSSPYSLSWTPAVGTYSITARATDNAGATTTSGAASITIRTVTSGCTVAAWTAGGIYVQGNRVSYSGTIYEAKWWTQGQNPSTNSGTWDVWKVIGPCTARVAFGALTEEEEEWHAANILLEAAPNPTIGNIQLNMELPAGEFVLEVRNSMNELILSQTMSGGIYQQELNLQGQANGMYLIMIKSELGNKMLRVIKQ